MNPSENRTDAPGRSDASPGLRCYVLAAGRGRRMGGNKALLPHGDEPLLFAIARAYAESCGAHTLGLVDEVTRDVLVEEWRRCVPQEKSTESFAGLDLSLLVEVDPDEPMMDSVRLAFRDARARGCARFFLQPVDAGVPSHATLHALSDRVGEALVVKPTHGGRGGHPLLITSEALEILEWEESDSLRHALRGLSDSQLSRVEVEDPGVLRNWNRPQDVDVEKA